MDRLLLTAALIWSTAACTMSNPAFHSDVSDGGTEAASGSASGGASLESGSHDTSTTRDTSDSQSGDADTKTSNATSEASDATASEGSFIDATSETRTGTDGSDASDDEAESAACEPLTEDPSAILELCESDDDCADDAYTCWEIIGIVAQWRCSILCEADCECPVGYSCVMHSDKVKSWHECSQ
jgi:hypothetical protein